MQKFMKNTKTEDMSDVDFYILQHGTDKQERLKTIRVVVKEIFPESSERVYYGIPTVANGGKDILHYAAYKNHISLIVGYDLSAYLQVKYPQYDYTRATVVLPDKEPFPENFIREIMSIKATEDLKG